MIACIYVEISFKKHRSGKKIFRNVRKGVKSDLRVKGEAYRGKAANNENVKPGHQSLL